LDLLVLSYISGSHCGGFSLLSCCQSPFLKVVFLLFKVKLDLLLGVCLQRLGVRKNSLKSAWLNSGRRLWGTSFSLRSRGAAVAFCGSRLRGGTRGTLVQPRAGFVLREAHIGVPGSPSGSHWAGGHCAAGSCATCWRGNVVTSPESSFWVEAAQHFPPHL
jgi:hypothetical protein